MKLSVVVPIYNVEVYLRRCLDSLINQTMDDYEVILIDDGSSDKSGAIADQYEKEYKIIKVIHQQNKGLSGARNTGLRAAHGKYVVFVDSDDWIEINTLKLLVNEAERWNLDVGVADFRYVYENGVETENLEKPLRCSEALTGPIFFKDSMKILSSLATVWKSIYRTSFLIENHLFFREGFNHEDEEWTPRVYLKAQRVKNIPIIFYNYFIHTDTISKDPKSFEKNSLDLISNCYELKKLSFTVSDKELRELFQNRIASLFLSAFYKGRLYSLKYKSIVNRSFFADMYLSSANKKKVILFSLNKRLYVFVNSMKKIKGKYE